MKKSITVIISIVAFIFAVTISRADDAKTMYDKSCAACHGKDGKGETPAGKKLKVKDYTDAKVQASLTDEQIIKDIKEGVTVDGKVKMKGFGDKLTDDEIKALVTYIRGFKK